MHRPRLTKVALVIGVLFAILNIANAAGFGHSHAEECTHCAQASIGRRRYVDSVGVAVEATCLTQRNLAAAPEAQIETATIPIEIEAVAILDIPHFAPSTPIRLSGGNAPPDAGEPLATPALARRSRAPPVLA